MTEIIDAIIEAEYDDLIDHMVDEYALASLAFELEQLL